MNTQLVTISTYDKTTDADLAKLYLEASGITVFLIDYHMVGLDWLRAGAFGGIKLRVAENDVVQALARLDELANNRNRYSDDQGDEICLSCGSTMPLGKDTCSKCGWSYIE